MNMNKLIPALLVCVLAASLTTGCAADKKVASEMDVKPVVQEVKKFQETSNTHILQSLEEDLRGNNNKAKIVLYSELDNNGMPVSWSLVIDGIEKVKLPQEDGGLYSFAEVAFEDVDRDGNKEVLFYRQSGGSAGARGLSIYRPSEKDWQLIFSVKNPFDFGDTDGKRYEVKYLGDYYASFEDKQTGMKSTIALDKTQYIGQEEMLKNISTWVDPIAEYSLVDYDGDGIKEIIAIQRVIGISHPDTLALLKTTYKLEHGQYKAVTLCLSNMNDKPLAEVTL